MGVCRGQSPAAEAPCPQSGLRDGRYGYYRAHTMPLMQWTKVRGRVYACACGYVLWSQPACAIAAVFGIAHSLVGSLVAGPSCVGWCKFGLRGLRGTP